MGVIALLIIGAAVLPLEPKLLGCKYGEESKMVVPLGSWTEKPQLTTVCKDGPGNRLLYETWDQVCERALRDVASAVSNATCTQIPTGYKAFRPITQAECFVPLSPDGACGGIAGFGKKGSQSR